MQRKRDGLVPIGEAVSRMDDGPMKALAKTSPQVLHHFTLSDQVNPCRGQRSGPRQAAGLPDRLG